MPVQLLTKSAYARHRGCDEKAVRNAITTGRISTINGKIDPAVADLQWQANTRARVRRAPLPPGTQSPAAARANTQPAAGGAPVGGESDYARDRARREAAEADLAELRVGEQRGELIRVSAVETVWAGFLARVREHLLQVRSRLAPLLAAEGDVFRIEQLLDEELSQALWLLARAEVRDPEGI